MAYIGQQRIIAGENDKQASILDSNFKQLKLIELGSELLSVMAFNNAIYCGLSSNTLCVLDSTNF